MTTAPTARIGFVGAGWWATRNHMPIVRDHPGATIAAVCRLGASELEAVRAEFSVPYASEDYDAVLEDCELDGVVVTSPHHLHFEHAVKALEAGAHVLVEKPMTVSAADARELVAIAARAGREILVPNGWNFRPYLARAREIVAEGGIGTLRHVAVAMASPAEALFSGQAYPGTEQDMFQPPAATWADPNAYGGYGWGQLPHLLAALFRIAGPELVPSHVTALASPSPTGVDLFDAALLEFDGGVKGVLSGAGNVPMNSRFQLDIRLFGSGGMLLFDVERERVSLRRHDDANEEVAVAPGTGDYGCEAPVRAFVALCRGESIVNEAPGWVGMRAIEVIDAMYRSIATGSRTSV